jgi:hypothetical protein
MSFVILFRAWPTCSGPLAYGGPSWSVNVGGVSVPRPSSTAPPPPLCDSSSSFSKVVKRASLRCHAYRSSVHRRRYSEFVAGDGRGGKLDLGWRADKWKWDVATFFELELWSGDLSVIGRSQRPELVFPCEQHHHDDDNIEKVRYQLYA